MDQHPIAQATDDVDASLQDEQQLSPESQQNLALVEEKIRRGEAKLVKDESGNPKLVYQNERNVTLSYVDKSQANLIASPKSEKDTQNRLDACLEMINFLKHNRAPKGVIFDRTKVRSTGGKYREGEEFTKLDKVLGSGATAGDIVVVKDNKTEVEHAQKTVMISEFREEEVRAWVDLDSDGFCPSLYTFHVEDNKIVFRMEKLERAITLRDVIDSHMKKLHEECQDLVRPFSLHIFHGLLSSVQHMHTKNWTHRDLHAGNVMIQESDGKLQLKVLDFGKANVLRRQDSYDLSGEQDDIYQVIRLFSAIYLGVEFDSAKDLKDNYAQFLQEIQGLSNIQKTEVFQVIDAAMDVAKSAAISPTATDKSMSKTLQQIGDKLGNQSEIDNMMKRVAAILFREEDYVPLHDEAGAKGDGGVDVCDAVGDLEDLEVKASHVPIRFLQELRLGINLRRHQ